MTCLVPSVSVVIAARNEQTYIRSAVLSVLAQEGVDHEVVVIDDNSTDNTFKIVSDLLGNHPNLRLERNPKSGKCSAFNFGVELARGRFVCIFAGDDLMPEGSLSDRWARVKDHPDNKPVVGLCKLISMSEDKRFDGHVVPRAPGRGVLTGISPLMNRLALHKMFPVPESLPNEDTWMELAVLYFADWVIDHCDVIGCKWRVHQGNSINMSVPFDEYNRKISLRMTALPLFRERYGGELGAESGKALDARISCEEARLRGSLLGVLSSPVGLVDKLRSLSITNAFFYRVRSRLYGLFSGW